MKKSVGPERTSGKLENDITTSNEFFFKQVRSWKPCREIVELANGQGMTGRKR